MDSRKNYDGIDLDLDSLLDVADSRTKTRPRSTGASEPVRRASSVGKTESVRRPVQSGKTEPARRPVQPGKTEPARRPAQTSKTDPVRRPAQTSKPETARRQTVANQPVTRPVSEKTLQKRPTTVRETVSNSMPSGTDAESYYADRKKKALERLENSASAKSRKQYQPTRSTNVNDEAINAATARKSSKIVERYAEKENPRDAYRRDAMNARNAQRAKANRQHAFTEDDTAEKYTKNDSTKIIGLAIVVIALLVVIIVVKFFTSNSVSKKADQAMLGYYNQIREMINDGSFANYLVIDESIAAGVGGVEEYRKNYLRAMQYNFSDFTIRRSRVSTDEKAPVYDLDGDGQLVARIALKPVKTNNLRFRGKDNWVIDHISAELTLYSTSIE